LAIVRHRALLAMLLAAGTISSAADAAGAAPLTIALSISSHHFQPDVVTAPAGQRFTIRVSNLDPTPEEFESYDLKVERIVTPHGNVLVPVGPLKPGAYAFFGDYNPTLAKGVLKVVPAVAR
jgi:hypothetical protein